MANYHVGHIYYLDISFLWFSFFTLHRQDKAALAIYAGITLVGLILDCVTSPPQWVCCWLAGWHGSLWMEVGILGSSQPQHHTMIMTSAQWVGLARCWIHSQFILDSVVEAFVSGDRCMKLCCCVLETWPNPKCQMSRWSRMTGLGVCWSIEWGAMFLSRKIINRKPPQS